MIDNQFAILKFTKAKKEAFTFYLPESRSSKEVGEKNMLRIM